MYFADPGGTPDAFDQAWRVVQAVAAAMLAGSVTERALDTGVHVRGIGPLAGLVGLYVGAWLWAWGGWAGGPTIGDHAIAPTVVGALAVCGVLKLVGLGAAGPRW